MKSNRFKSRRRGFKNPHTSHAAPKNKQRVTRKLYTHYVEFMNPINGEWMQEGVYNHEYALIHCMLLSITNAAIPEEGIPATKYRVRGIGHRMLTDEQLRTRLSHKKEEVACA